MSIHQFQSRAQLMSAVTWQQKLDTAADVHGVVETVKDYVSSLDHRDIARLPVPCLPGKFFDANDVSSYALTLLRYPPTGDAGVDSLVRKLAAFFSDASTRLALILTGTHVDNDRDEQRSA